jgi:hypothetical protein
MGVARILLCLTLAAAFSASAAAADKPAFRRWYDYDYTIRSAELCDVTQRIETEVNSSSLVQPLGQNRIVNNDRYFDLDIVEAATIKPDGRRIDVQRDQIAVLSGTEAATNILFQTDIKTRVVPFPELEAGDRTRIYAAVRNSATADSSVIVVIQPWRPYALSVDRHCSARWDSRSYSSATRKSLRFRVASPLI